MLLATRQSILYSLKKMFPPSTVCHDTASNGFLYLTQKPFFYKVAIAQTALS